MSKPSKPASILSEHPTGGCLWPEAAQPSGFSAEEAHVWAIPCDIEIAPSHSALACLSAEERRRAEQFQLEAPRRRFIAARAALRQLLGAYLGAPAADISLEYNARGKPRLVDGIGGGLYFNLAHTSDLVLVAVTRGCDVGVDVERIRSVSHLESIARRYFHPVEVERVLATSIELRHEAFLRCWTAKEAVLKAIGTGLTESLAAFCTLVSDGRGTWIELPKCENVDATRCWLVHLSPCDGAIGAVAFVGQQRQVHCFTLAMDVV